MKEQNQEENVKVIKDIKKTRVITFDKPYQFECDTYKELDLSGLDDLTTDDLLQAERIYNRAGGTSINPETTMLYSMILAQLASNQPFEFFGPLLPREAMKIKKEVYDFFYKAE